MKRMYKIKEHDEDVLINWERDNKSTENYFQTPQWKYFFKNSW